MRFWKKKEQKPYPRTFAKRLTWRIMLRIGIIMTPPLLIMFMMAYGLIYTFSDLIAGRIVKGNCETIRRITSDLYVAATNTAPIIEENLEHPEKMHAIMERMLKLNPYIRSCGISFTEGYYPSKGRWFCPYVVRRDSATSETMTLGGKGYDYLQADWFHEAMSRQEGYWGKAFLDSTDHNTPIVSYLLPIHDRQHRTVAVLGVDLSLDWLGDKIQFGHAMKNADHWDADKMFYYFMTDSSGTLMIHPDKKRIVRTKIQQYTTAGNNAIKQILTHQKLLEESTRIEDVDVMVAYNPVKFTNWSLVLVFPELFIDIFGYLVGGLFIGIIAISLLVVWLFGRMAIKRATRPLQRLAATADEVAKGRFDTRLPDVNTRDEIHQLRDSFENMQHALKKYIEELKVTTAENASMESELKVAHDIQMSMLPKTFPPYPERKDIDIYGSLTPAKGVGGDLFDFHIRDEKLFFCIGDVSGKGVPASLYMAVTRSLFRNVSSHESDPERIVAALNKAQSEGNDTNMFVTVFVGVLDLATGQLHYCNAGHDAPLLVGRDVAALPCDPNLPIGVIADFKFSRQQLVLDQGTTIFLFTDGLNEAENAQHQQFGDNRIWQLAKKQLAANNHQPQQLIETMTQAVHQFVGDAEQSDDLTMLAIQYKG